MHPNQDGGIISSASALKAKREPHHPGRYTGSGFDQVDNNNSIILMADQTGETRWTNYFINISRKSFNSRHSPAYFSYFHNVVTSSVIGACARALQMCPTRLMSCASVASHQRTETSIAHEPAINNEFNITHHGLRSVTGH